MCGINGFFAYRPEAPPADLDELVAIRDAMARRGPDNAGQWVSPDRRIAFGHRRLSIIDLSPAGNGPMTSADGVYTIAFNGEIYNYRELRTDLEAEGVSFRTQSDTEVVLAVYERFGPEGFARLRGMFAFALWDERNQRLVLVRDALGIKPLYLADQGGAIRFASQVKALLHSPAIDRTPDPAGHTGFFLWGHIPEPFTLYRGIRMLPAGSFLVVEAGGVQRTGTIFDLHACLATGAEPGDAASLREILEDTTRAHFVADVPVSLFLSAGRDSTTLLALAAHARTEPIHTVTLAFDEFVGTPRDEAPLAAEVAAKYGAHHRVHRVSIEDFRQDVEAHFDAMDQPSVDGANTYFIAQVAARLGVRVALSGVGADELFGGYSSYLQVPRLARRTRWLKEAAWLGRGVRRAAAPLLPPSVSPKYAGLFEYGPTVEGAFLLRRALFMPWELERVLDPDVVREGLDALQPIDALRTLAQGLPTDHAKIVALEIVAYMRHRLLRDSDWASMAHSLELRTPFVDRVVLERLGPWIAGPCPPTKSEMARCPADPVPPAVLNRPKTGFDVPIRQWLLGLEASDSKERTWRQWARFVYRHQIGDDLLRSRKVAT